MSDDILVHRPDMVEDITAPLREVWEDERRRRWLQKFIAWTPWFIALCMSLFAVGEGIVMARRPIPEPKVYIAIYRSDGSVEVPVERGNLSMDRKAFIVKADLQNFIVAYESYNWRANQAYWERVSTMAGAELKKQYQDSWSNRKDPNNRDVRYGGNVQRNIVQIRTSYVTGAPFALTGNVLIKETTPEHATCEWWHVELTYRVDTNTIPIDLQLSYDPSDSIVMTYFSTLADPTAKPQPC